MSSSFVTVIKSWPKKTPSTPGVANNRLASGETCACAKFRKSCTRVFGGFSVDYVWKRFLVSNERTMDDPYSSGRTSFPAGWNFNPFGFGVDDVWMNRFRTPTNRFNPPLLWTFNTRRNISLSVSSNFQLCLFASHVFVPRFPVFFYNSASLTHTHTNNARD